ncbi:hypothetical protein GCM10010415_01650 [Streptomyces atrovirens]
MVLRTPDTSLRSLRTLVECPASNGNNDWNPDRIPNPPPDFSDHAVPCRATRGGPRPSEHEEVQVRPGAEGDPTALTDLYDHYARETAITFDTAPFTREEHLSRPPSHPVDGPCRLMVATGAGSRRIPGYATSSPSTPSSPFRPEPACATSVETPARVTPDTGRRRPAGRRLGTAARAFRIPARRHVPRGVGRRSGRRWDVTWYGKPL